MNEIYRFRSEEKLLFKDEIDKCVMYGASSEELNDPIEGYKNIHWKGCSILWTNLFKNYLFALDTYIYEYLILGQDVLADKIYPLHVNRRGEDAERNEILVKIYDKFFAATIVQNIIENCVNADKINRSELETRLKHIHRFALNSLQATYLEYNLLEATLLLNWDKILDYTKHDDQFYIVNDRKIRMLNENTTTILYYFPEVFMRDMERIIFCSRGIICFSKEWNHSSMWSHYANSHKGACMIFEPAADNKLKLIRRSGGRDQVNDFALHDVDYSGRWPEVNFFEFIGNIPVPVRNTWLVSDDDHRISDIGKYIYNNEQEWREKYWNTYNEAGFIKTSEWEWESESRLMFPLGMATGFYNRDDQRLKYDFNQLTGIIFGIKMERTHKKLLAQKIINKCYDSGKKSFSFYQAFFCEDEFKIKRDKLDYSF